MTNQAGSGRQGRPDKGTPEYDVWIAAIEVAIAAPLRSGTNVHNATVPWSRITELRDALTRAGIDWKGVKRKQRELDQAASS